MKRSHTPVSRIDLSTAFELAGQHGFSLVELMIAMTLGLIVIGGLTQVYIGGRDANRIIESTTLLNDNGRFAMEFFGRDLRMAGYFSCQGDNANIANAVSISDGTPTQQFWFKLPGNSTLPLGIEGFEVGVDTLPIPLNNLGALSGTDMFVARYTDTRDPIDVCVDNATIPRVCETKNTVLDANGKTFTFTDPHRLNAGDIVVMNALNCDQTRFFQVTAAQDDNYGRYIGYGDNPSIGPGNCVPAATGNYVCSISQSLPPNPPSLTQDEVNGATMAKYIARAFYVADDPGNCPNVQGDCGTLAQCPTLFAIDNQTTGAVPVLRNVSDMQIEYGYNPGIDTSGGLVINRSDDPSIELDYKTASEVAYSSDQAINDNEWLKIASIKITVTIITNLCKAQTFSTTVALRNAGRIVRLVD